MKLMKATVTIVLFSLMTGCASVNMAPQQQSTTAKQFAAPDEGKAGIYVFRKDSSYGAALKKDIWIDGKCLGQSARGVFFYRQVEGDREHEIATASEFSPNAITLTTKAGRNYYVQQYIKMGVFSGGASLRQHNDASGKCEVSRLEIARSGSCRGLRWGRKC